MDLVQVSFRSDTIDVIEKNGQYFVSVKKICQNLGIVNLSRQYKQIKSEEALESTYIEVPTAGGVQKVFCIPLEKLNGWLFTINPNKVKPEVKEKLIAYKNECFKVLYNHFLKKAQPMEEVSLESISGKILGYKGQLAKANKRIKELELEIAHLKEEVGRVPHNPIDEMMRGLFGFTFDDLKKKNNKERE